jgi:hypothetical protein
MCTNTANDSEGDDRYTTIDTEESFFQRSRGFGVSKQGFCCRVRYVGAMRNALCVMSQEFSLRVNDVVGMSLDQGDFMHACSRPWYKTLRGRKITGEGQTLTSSSHLPFNGPLESSLNFSTDRNVGLATTRLNSSVESYGLHT